MSNFRYNPGIIYNQIIFFMKAVLLNKFKVGDIVKMKVSFLNEPVGTKAYVYEVYNIGREQGVSIITENGIDIGGFSGDEQWKYLEFVSHSGFYYEFRSVSWLAVDWNNGVFDNIFAKKQNSSFSTDDPTFLEP